MYTAQTAHPIPYFSHRTVCSSKLHPRTGKYTQFYPVYRKFENQRWEKLEPMLDKMENNIAMVPEMSERALKELDRMIRIFERGSRKHYYGAYYGNGPIYKAFDRFYYVNEKIKMFNEARTRCEALNKCKSEFNLPPANFIDIDEYCKRFDSAKRQTEESYKKASKEYLERNEEAIWNGFDTTEPPYAPLRGL